MIVNMLKAVDKMLDGNNSPEKISCARAVLGEIIKHLESNPLPVLGGAIANGLSRTYIDDELEPDVQEIQKEIMG